MYHAGCFTINCLSQFAELLKWMEMLINFAFSLAAFLEIWLKFDLYLDGNLTKI